MDFISRGGQGAKRLWTESVRNAEHFETVPDLIELSLSGGDARRGNTRSHPEHDGYDLYGRWYYTGDGMEEQAAARLI